MSNNNNTHKLNNISHEGFNWSSVQKEMKSKLGNDIYESWLKKIDFVEEINNYILC